MENHRTTSQEFPGWYVEFQAALLTHAPRPGEINQDVALGWCDNGEAFRRTLNRELVPPPETGMSEDIVDCDVLPEIRCGEKCEEHRRMGRFTLKKYGDELYANGKKVILYLTDGQKKGGIKGLRLREELKRKLVLNVCFYDYLRKHQWLIPRSWRKERRSIYFWGTTFSCLSGAIYSPALWWNDDVWDINCTSSISSYGFGDNDFAVILAD